VDTGLDENKTEFGVLVLSVALEMLADGDGLLDQHVQVFWDAGSKTVRPEDAENLVSSNDLDLCDSMAVTENDTDLRWSGTLTSELGDLVDDLVGGGLQP